jgi:hypothetical protein
MFEEIDQRFHNVLLQNLYFKFHLYLYQSNGKLSEFWYRTLLLLKNIILGHLCASRNMQENLR